MRIFIADASYIENKSELLLYHAIVVNVVEFGMHCVYRFGGCLRDGVQARGPDDNERRVYLPLLLAFSLA